MARQTSKKVTKAPIRTARTTKKDVASKRGFLVAGALLTSLAILIVASVFAFRSEKDASIATKIDKKIESVRKKDDSKVIVKKETPKDTAKVSMKVAAVKPEEEDIAAVIRLVLYDYEISRAAVNESVDVSDGVENITFNIFLHDDISAKVRSTLNNVLHKKGYKIKLGKNKLTAHNSKKLIEISFTTTEQVATKAPDKPKDTPTVRDKKSTASQQKVASAPRQPAEVRRPTPPTKSPNLVKIAILLDDGGANLVLAERVARFKYPVAVAILPHLQYSTEIARLLSSYKKTIFLHFPMEPKSYPNSDPGEGAALLNMPEILIEGVAKNNFESLGIRVDGVNNHMGSAFTEDRVKMSQVLGIMKQYTDIFIDSRTSADSIAYDECRKSGMKCGINKRFIDNDNNVNTIIEKIYEAAEMAKQHGEVIIIGHVRSRTLDALDIAMPILEDRKIAIVPIEQLVR